MILVAESSALLLNTVSMGTAGIILIMTTTFEYQILNLFLLLADAMCDFAAALNVANHVASGWNCVCGTQSPSVICGWVKVSCNGESSVTVINFPLEPYRVPFLPALVASLL